MRVIDGDQRIMVQCFNCREITSMPLWMFVDSQECFNYCLGHLCRMKSFERQIALNRSAGDSKPRFET